jgi:hypothetical protein
LQADLGFQNFDLGKFLRAAAPDSPPTVEGVFSGLGKASGEGETLNLMFEKTMGSVALKSVRGGVFRGLKANGKANFAVGMGALIGGFADRPGLVALSRMTQALREVPYSEAALLLERGESLDVDLKRLVILGPTLQAIGIGKTQYREGVPITEQPMQVNLHLAAKGSLANDLYILDLLAGEKNELEYWPLKNRYQPIPLTGSLSKIDPRAFYSLAASAANSARSRSSAEIGVLGRAESTAGAGDNLDGAAAESSQIQPDKAPAREPTPGEILLEAILNRARSQGGP